VVVPKQINLDSLYREPITNVIEENTYFITYCPDFSQWPYETWIAPKAEGVRFGDTKDSELPDLRGYITKTSAEDGKNLHRPTIKPKDRSDNTFVYNYYIYHGQTGLSASSRRFIHRAGFELGTGLNVNVVDPVEASKEILEVKVT